MTDEKNSRNSGNDLLCSDYSEVHLLGGPWDSGVVTLGKEFNAPERLYCRPFFTIDGEGMVSYYVHSGFIGAEPADRSAPYHFAYASDPELDDQKNVRVRYYYIYDKLLRWRVTN